jgi:cytochrome c553
MKIIKISILMACFLLIVSCATEDRNRNYADTNLSGRVLAEQVCSACHGVTGQSISPQFPKLAGQQKDYLLGQLIDFKGHQRQDRMGKEYMWGFSKLTLKQVDELAQYFSQQTPMVGQFANNGVLMQRGEIIFKEGIPTTGVIPCSACHGPEGTGNGPIPRIAGQHADYLEKQIEIFKNTNLRPRGDAMKEVTHQLTKKDMLAVVTYIGSLNSVAP